MGDLVNKKNITEGALAISNSRVDGSQKIKDVDELKNRTRLYKEYSSNRFGKVYGEFGPEYGKPYDMLGETKYHTYKKIKSHFKNEAEYLKYIRELK